ncbi:MAG: hypothetical protein P8J53_04490 [Alphaproteobacteria bacterium]|jgi:hypothetical protein|nr:hypothetical protein [Alphaproteobacteria bacterium]
MKKNLTKRNYFVVIDNSQEMWKAVHFCMIRAKAIKAKITTISFAESISDQIMLVNSAENIIHEEQIKIEKLNHNKVHSYLKEKLKIDADSKVFMSDDLDGFIKYLNDYSSNSTIVLASSTEIGKPGPLIDKLVYEKSNLLKCPLVIISGNLSNKELESIV